MPLASWLPVLADGADSYRIDHRLADHDLAARTDRCNADGRRPVGPTGSPIGRWAFQQKGQLSTIAQCGILSMVLVGMVNCGERLASTAPVTWADWLKMAIACASLHLLGLAVGFGAGRMTGLGREEWIAVGIAEARRHS